MPAPILTKHARDRLKQRWITEDTIESVLRSPDRTEPGSTPGSVKFIRTINSRQIHVVGKYLDDQDRWLVVSVWVRGEEDSVPFMWQLITLPFKLLWKLILLLSPKKTAPHSGK